MAECKEICFIENIKSSFIMDSLFSFLNKKQKLKLIIYNKKLQKRLGVDIKDYQKISGKYIKKRNGIIKEYTMANKLIFEGHYLNGKKSGLCKEFYNNGKIKFEGNYSDGKKSGKGTEFYDNGKLKFKGEYLNGKKWNGALYSINGKDHFEIKNGKGYIKELNYYQIYGSMNLKGNIFDFYEDTSEIILLENI